MTTQKPTTAIELEQRYIEQNSKQLAYRILKQLDRQGPVDREKELLLVLVPLLRMNFELSHLNAELAKNPEEQMRAHLLLEKLSAWL